MNRFNRELIGLHSERWHTLEFMFLCWSSQDIQNPGACEASMHLLCPQLDTGLIPTSPDSRGVTVPSESRGGGRLLDEIHGPESHAVFDVTLEHATRPELHPRKDP